MNGWKVEKTGAGATRHRPRRWKLKNLIVILVIVMTIAGSANAATIELDRTNVSRKIQICAEFKITSKTGGFAYSNLSDKWSEGYAGMTYAPIPEIQVAFGAGAETDSNAVRTGGWLKGSKGKTAVFYAFENGKTGPWHKLVAKYAVTPKFSLGYTEKSKAGRGLYADYKVSQTATLKFSGFTRPELALNVKF